MNMGDRFKFRAWQKDKKTMCQVTALYYYDEGDSFCVTLKEKDNVSNSRPIEDVELMQCTGIRGRNNELIYEGDILFWKVEPVFGESLLFMWYKVMFDNGRYFLSSKYEVKLMNEIASENYTIKGNIYETPELVERTLYED